MNTALHNGKHFTLVHASWMAAWEWQAVASSLHAAGHRCLAVDLPGRGSNPASIPQGQLALDDYVDSIARQLLPLGEKTIVVAHGGSGIVASQLAEHCPERIEAAVYLAGLMLGDGASLAATCSGITTSAVVNNLRFSGDGLTVELDRGIAHQAFAADVDKAHFEKLTHELTAEPTALMKTTLSLSDSRYGTVPRYYIECTRDNVVPIGFQQAMAMAQTLEAYYTMDSSHAPMLSQPDELCDILEDIAKHRSHSGTADNRRTAR